MDVPQIYIYFAILLRDAYDRVAIDVDPGDGSQAGSAELAVLVLDRGDVVADVCGDFQAGGVVQGLAEEIAQLVAQLLQPAAQAGQGVTQTVIHGCDWRVVSRRLGGAAAAVACDRRSAAPEDSCGTRPSVSVMLARSLVGLACSPAIMRTAGSPITM